MGKKGIARSHDKYIEELNNRTSEEIKMQGE